LKQIRKRLTYANVMSSIAVFLVLGGAAVAATQLPKNSVGAKQLKKEAVTKAKIKNDAVDSAKVKPGSLLSSDFQAGQLPAGPKGDTGPQGATGPQGPEGTALAYALVSSGGNVDPAGSKGITSADVSLDETGTYCFNKIPVGTKSIVATTNGQFLSFTETDRFASVSFIPTNPTPNWSGCDPGAKPVRVTTFDQSAGGLANSAFMIWFED
jgi:hypothetical protein